MKQGDKILRGNASQFFVAGELCRRGLVAVVTLGNTPNTDILCSNTEGTRFAHIQVKAFKPQDDRCMVSQKAEINYGYNFFWVLGGIPQPDSDDDFEYYVIPSRIMAKNTKECHKLWLKTLGRKALSHKDNPMRGVHLPPSENLNGWSIKKYKNRWDLIERCVRK